MLIGIYLDIKLGDGGGFNQALNDLCTISERRPVAWQIIIITPFKENFEKLRTLGFEPRLRKMSILDHFFVAFSQNYIFKMIIKKFRLLSRFEKSLDKMKIDLMYFVTPSKVPMILFEIPFIYTIWDLCHLDYPEFKEVRSFNEFEIREFKNNIILPKALGVLCDSNVTKKKLVERYRINQDRVQVFPFAPSMFLVDKPEEKPAIKDNENINGNYFLYPAQYWSHKNHLSILKAMLYLRDKKMLKRKVIFTGKNYGTKEQLELFCEKNNLLDYVEFRNFVSTEKLRELYIRCWAVIMPTYFGPTNLPPLEALFFKKPVIYTKYMKFSKKCAILVDPDNPKTIANAIIKLENSKVRDVLLKEGEKYLQKLEGEREIAIADIISYIEVIRGRLISSQIY